MAARIARSLGKPELSCRVSEAGVGSIAASDAHYSLLLVEWVLAAAEQGEHATVVRAATLLLDAAAHIPATLSRTDLRQVFDRLLVAYCNVAHFHRLDANVTRAHLEAASLAFPEDYAIARNRGLVHMLLGKWAAASKHLLHGMQLWLATWPPTAFPVAPLPPSDELAAPPPQPRVINHAAIADLVANQATLTPSILFEPQGGASIRHPTHDFPRTLDGQTQHSFNLTFSDRVLLETIVEDARVLVTAQAPDTLRVLSKDGLHAFSQTQVHGLLDAPSQVDLAARQVVQVGCLARTHAHAHAHALTTFMKYVLLFYPLTLTPPHHS